jgi:hypothetical protein
MKYTAAGELGELAKPENRGRAVACLNEMITDALECVPECMEYMAMLKTEEVFRFCAIPQVMSCLALSCLALSCLALSCLALPCLALPCLKCCALLCIVTQSLESPQAASPHSSPDLSRSVPSFPLLLFPSFSENILLQWVVARADCATLSAPTKLSPLSFSQSLSLCLCLTSPGKSSSHSPSNAPPRTHTHL